VDLKEGATFKCSAVLRSGGRRIVTVKIGKVSGNSGQLRIVSAKPLK
jgi:hypothetical protein